MTIKHIIGRQDEKRILELALKSPDSEFIAVYGRRRIGRTHLIRDYFDDKICFEITGKHGVSLKYQLENFSYSLHKAMKIGIQPQRPESWSEAFWQLEQFLSSPAGMKKGGKGVVFLDELPWLNTPRSKFLSGLEHFWNHWGSRQKKAYFGSMWLCRILDDTKYRIFLMFSNLFSTLLISRKLDDISTIKKCQRQPPRRGPNHEEILQKQKQMDKKGRNFYDRHLK